MDYLDHLDYNRDMKTLHIQLEDESHKRLKGYAVEHGFSMKQVIEEFIEVSLGVIELAQQVKVSKPTPAPTPEKNKSVGKCNFCKLHQMDKEYCGLMKH